MIVPLLRCGRWSLALDFMWFNWRKAGSPNGNLIGWNTAFLFMRWYWIGPLTLTRRNVA